MFLPVIKPVFRLTLKIASFILFAVTLAAAYGGRVNPDILAFPSILVLALPYLAIASVIVTAAWLASGRFVTAAFGVAAIAASWAPITNAVPLRFPSKPENEARTFKLLSYNIIHGEDQENPESPSGNRSIEYLINSGADLIGLQELYNLGEGEIPNFSKELRDSLFSIYPYTAGTSGSDLKALSKYPVKLVKEYTSGQSRYSLYEVEMPFGKLNWINMHMTSYNLSDKERGVVSELANVKTAKDGMREMKGTIRRKLADSFRLRSHQTDELASLIESIDGPLIVSGDLNDVPESYSYRKLHSAGMDDAFAKTSFGPTVTYNRHAFWFHLDQILYRGDLKPLRTGKGKLKSSDHFPVTAEFEYK